MVEVRRFVTGFVVATSTYMLNELSIPGSTYLHPAPKPKPVNRVGSQSVERRSDFVVVHRGGLVRDRCINCNPVQRCRHTRHASKIYSILNSSKKKKKRHARFVRWHSIDSIIVMGFLVLFFHATLIFHACVHVVGCTRVVAWNRIMSVN